MLSSYYKPCKPLILKHTSIIRDSHGQPLIFWGSLFIRIFGCCVVLVTLVCGSISGSDGLSVRTFLWQIKNWKLLKGITLHQKSLVQHLPLFGDASIYRDCKSRVRPRFYQFFSLLQLSIEQNSIDQAKSYKLISFKTSDTLMSAHLLDCVLLFAVCASSRI